MPFSNLEYLYAHLPARVRRDDEGLFLKRFLTYVGEQLDGWDATLDNFYQLIAPDTAPEEFIDWWLWAFFGWSWYPKWFTLARKRQLYADFATHLARRGTKRGIEEFMRAFSVYVRVHNRPQYWGEFVWGDTAWVVESGRSFNPIPDPAPSGPEAEPVLMDDLGFVVEVSHLADEVNHDVQGMIWGEMVWGEGFSRETEATLTRREIEDLLRFQWPAAQRVMVEYKVRPNVAGPEAWEEFIPWDEDIVPDESSGAVIGA